MKFSPQQQSAIAAVKDWLGDPGRQIFRLFGYAGTGKTTLAKHLAGGLRRPPAYAAFTGKAAKVLQQKGCDGASTIHSLIYETDEDETSGLSRFKISWKIMANVDVVIIDECSMVDEDLAKDLIQFGKKILVLGDPAQLPPVKGAGFFTETEPDFMLDEVHRQAAESNILRLATQIRKGVMPSKLFESTDLTITRRAGLDQRLVTEAGAILVGKNATRRRFNTRMREIRKFEGEFPGVGETLICLKNDKTAGVLNGSTWLVKERGRSKTTSDGELLRYDLEDADAPGWFVNVQVFEQFFQSDERVKELDWRSKKGTQEFDYGYAITVHKSQGSQWDDVCVFNEAGTFGQDRHRWAYTACTRAAKHLTLVL